MTEPTIALYVSVNPKNPVPVSRFGTGIAGVRANTLIGARRDVDNPRTVHYEPDHVIAIPEAEFNRYMREYNRALKTGDLIRRSKEEFEAAKSKREEAEKKAAAETLAAKKKAIEDRKAKQKAEKEQRENIVARREAAEKESEALEKKRAKKAEEKGAKSKAKKANAAAKAEENADTHPPPDGNEDSKAPKTPKTTK